VTTLTFCFPTAWLIAAAPVLLEACEAALLREDVADCDLGDLIRAAIKKTKGGSIHV